MAPFPEGSFSPAVFCFFALVPAGIGKASLRFFCTSTGGEVPVFTKPDEAAAASTVKGVSGAAGGVSGFEGAASAKNASWPKVFAGGLLSAAAVCFLDAAGGLPPKKERMSMSCTYIN
jgi:hypothetical protein